MEEVGDIGSFLSLEKVAFLSSSGQEVGGN